MKSYRLPIVTMAILLCVASGLVFAQDTPAKPADAAPFDYSLDRLQYEGQGVTPEPIVPVGFDYNLDRLQYEGQGVTPEPIAEATLPPSMANSLVPCTVASTGPCDLIATSAEDIAGVWRQYVGNPRINALGGMAYIRYNADGTFVIADSIENTAQPLEGYPAGTFSFEGAEFIIGPAAGTPPPCDVPPHYQLRVLQYGDQPVALRYVPIHDDCPARSEDLIQAGIWVAG
jgi:hypothetical protein